MHVPTPIAVPAIPLGTMALEVTVEEVVVTRREKVRLGEKGVVQRGRLLEHLESGSIP